LQPLPWLMRKPEAMGAYYYDFRQVSDSEVIELLRLANKK